MATHLKRTESVVQPALFRFDEHFELQDLIGASRNSEVRLVTGRHSCGISHSFLSPVVHTQVTRTLASFWLVYKGCLDGLRM